MMLNIGNIKSIKTYNIRYTKVDPRFLIRTLVEKPFSSKYGFKASFYSSKSSSLELDTPPLSSEKINGLSQRSVYSKSMQMNPSKALCMILARPGTEIDTKLRIVKNDMSLILSQNHCITQEL
jgi:hypothetical protein